MDWGECQMTWCLFLLFLPSANTISASTQKTSSCGALGMWFSSKLSNARSVVGLWWSWRSLQPLQLCCSILSVLSFLACLCLAVGRQLKAWLRCVHQKLVTVWSSSLVKSNSKVTWWKFIRSLADMLCVASPVPHPPFQTRPVILISWPFSFPSALLCFVCKDSQLNVCWRWENRWHFSEFRA